MIANFKKLKFFVINTIICQSFRISQIKMDLTSNKMPKKSVLLSKFQGSHKLTKTYQNKLLEGCEIPSVNLDLTLLLKVCGRGCALN